MCEAFSSVKNERKGSTMELTDSVKGLLTSCITELIDHQDDLVVDVRKEDDETATEGYAIFADIKVNPEDVGKVIGRQGRTIKSLRTLARALGAKHSVRVEVEIIEEEK